MISLYPLSGDPIDAVVTSVRVDQMSPGESVVDITATGRSATFAWRSLIVDAPRIGAHITIVWNWPADGAPSTKDAP